MITSVFGWLATLLLIFRQTFFKMPLRCPFFIGCYLFVSFFAAYVPTYNFRCNLSTFVSSLILHWAFRSLPKKRDEGTDPHDSDTAFFPIIEIAQWKSPFYCKSTLLCGIGWGCKNVDIKILPPNDDAFFSLQITIEPPQGLRANLLVAYDSKPIRDNKYYQLANGHERFQKEFERLVYGKMVDQNTNTDLCKIAFFRYLLFPWGCFGKTKVWTCWLE